MARNPCIKEKYPNPSSRRPRSLSQDPLEALPTRNLASWGGLRNRSDRTGGRDTESFLTYCARHFLHVPRTIPNTPRERTETVEAAKSHTSDQASSPSTAVATHVAVDAEAERREARSVTQARLTSSLVVWDALVPAALLVLAGRFEGVFGPPLNGGAAQITDRLAVFLALISPVGLAIAGGYNHRRRRGGSRLLFGLKLAVVGMAVAWTGLITSAIAGWPIDFAQMLALSVFLPMGWLLGRWACDRHPATGAERVLLVGSGTVAQRVLDLTVRHRERRLDVVGRLDSDSDPAPGDGGPPLLGDLSDLPEVIGAYGIQRVIVAFAPERDTELLDLLRHCIAHGVQVDIVPRFYELIGPTPHANSVGGLALMEVPSRGLSTAQRAVKRGLDIAGSLALLLVLSPLIAVIAATIAATDGRPILFRQTRVGQRGRTFEILKFRTMTSDCDTAGLARLAALADCGEHSLDDDEAIGTVVQELKTQSEARVTRLGGMLRAMSLDEIPQLFNVLRGDMSLIGPRPLRPFEVTSLNDWQQARQDLRPGLTGLWQVLGRSDVSWDERMQLDYTYVSHWSFASDLQILCRTLPAVLKKEGAV